VKSYYVEHIVNAGSIIDNREIVIRGSVIDKIDTLPKHRKKDLFHYAVPGFIDIHTHGGNGFDIMDGTSYAFSRIAEYHLKNGTTSFLGSSITAPLHEITSLLQTGREFVKRNEEKSLKGEEASLLGFHLEGPWISCKNLGAQNESYVIEPDRETTSLIDTYSDIIKMVTFSYHNEKAENFLQVLLKKAIIPACGHDETLDRDIIKGFNNGLKHITHIYSNTSSFQRKDGFKHLGTLEMALITPGVTVEVIADNRHITKYFWDFITHNKSPDDIIIVSDSNRAAGLPEDPERQLRLGDLDIVIDRGVAWLPDRSVFAGSITSMLKMFRILVNEWNVAIKDAVKITSFNQAKKLGISDRIGTIKEGKTADLILMDRELNIQKIIKSGVEVSVATCTQ
jgi:N-acetylglucosamine-6-phosphate deacetylase